MNYREFAALILSTHFIESTTTNMIVRVIVDLRCLTIKYHRPTLGVAVCQGGQYVHTSCEQV